MISRPLVSVIVAVYNAEKTIERCALSLFGQTLSDMEFIFVDDCTPDNSIGVLQSVLEKFPERKDQVHVIRHDTNQGVALTRQHGVDAASGVYTIHCDPDDWVDLDMYQKLYDIAIEEKADVVMCDFHGQKASTGVIEAVEPHEILAGIGGSCITRRHGGLWSKLVKTSLLHNRPITFPKGISYCEDVNYLFQLLKDNSLKVIDSHLNLYHYDYKPGGLCTAKSKDALRIDATHTHDLLRMRTKGEMPEYDEAIEAFTVRIAYRAAESNLLSTKEFKALFGHLSPFVSSIRYSRLVKLTMRLSLAISPKFAVMIRNLYEHLGPTLHGMRRMLKIR